MTFSITRALTEGGYIPSLCEKIFLEHNVPEPMHIEGVPIRMIFESKIWGIGELLRQHLRNKPSDRKNVLLLRQIIEVTQTCKYRSGRESFVMLLHLFAERELVEATLIYLLSDGDLYAHVLREMNKMKLYVESAQISEILRSEKRGWVKKELRKQLEGNLRGEKS